MRSSRMDKVVTYIWNREPSPSTYLEDGRCSFSNNPSENVIPSFVVGQKRGLFSDIAAGAETRANLYNGSECEGKWLKRLLIFKTISGSQPNNRMSNGELERFAPWNPEVKELLDCQVAEPKLPESIRKPAK
ncbi:hypothetical protein F220043C3_04700 [Enterocloster asparagiformis]